MSTDVALDASQWAELLEAARQGDDEALGQVCQYLRKYLLLTATEGLGAGLQSKLGASDVVQETMLDACRDFDRFTGQTEIEFRQWAKRLIKHNLVDTARRYRGSQRRDVRLEQTLDRENGRIDPLEDSHSPSEILQKNESDHQLQTAIKQLPADRQQLLKLRHRDGLSYSQIAQRMGMSEVAVRKLWSRTVQSLRQELSPLDETASQRFD